MSSFKQHVAGGTKNKKKDKKGKKVVQASQSQSLIAVRPSSSQPLGIIQSSPHQLHPTPSTQPGSEVASSSVPSPLLQSSPTETIFAGSERSPNLMSTDARCSSNNIYDAGSRLNDGRLVIRPNGNQEFFPSVESQKILSDTIHNKFEGVWPKFSKIPRKVQGLWFDEFKLKCTWDPKLDVVIHKIWKKKCSVVVRSSLRDIRKNKTKGEWLPEGVRKALEEYWKSPEFLAESARNKANRAADNGGCVHRGGRISFNEHKRRMEVELGRSCEYPEVFKKIQYDEKKGGWIGQKAEATYNEFERLKESQEPESNICDSDLWLKVVGGKNKKGHVYGLGSQAGLIASDCSSLGNNYGEIAQLKKEMEEQKKFYEESLQNVRAEMKARDEEYKARESRMEEQFRMIMAHLSNTKAGTSKCPRSDDSDGVDSDGTNDSDSADSDGTDDDDDDGGNEV